MTGRPSQIERGYQLLRQGLHLDALRLSSHVLASSPENPHALVLAAEAQLQDGKPAEALALMERAIVASGGNPILKLKKGRLLLAMRRRGEISALVEDVAAQATGNGNLLWLLGNLCYRCNMQSEAISYFEQARALIGDEPGLVYELALARFFSGDSEQAERDLERIPANSPQSAYALYLRATLRKQTPQRNHVENLRERIRQGGHSQSDNASLHYTLAKELEDLEEFDSSFASLRIGAAAQRSTLQYDVRHDIAAMGDMQAAYTAEALEAQVSDGGAGEGAIFVLGLPRSGTTLVERFLTQSGQARSAGELPDFPMLLSEAVARMADTRADLTPAAASLGVDFSALGREYMRGAREAARGHQVFIDKAPLNFFYCGAIRMALPRAKIIHLVRDPLDNCYALFKTLFFGAYDFSCDLDDLARYYAAYHQFMRHWHMAMPGRILDVQYEDLVTTPETEARRIYAWCQLEWTDAALDSPKAGQVFATASAAQVRGPIHRRSVDSSRRYPNQLASLRDTLTAAGITLKS